MALGVKVDKVLGLVREDDSGGLRLVGGPASAIDGAVPLFDGTTGKQLKDSTFTLIDDDSMATASATTLASAESIVAYIAATVSGIVFQGEYNATTDTPDLSAGTGILQGYTYVCTVAGNAAGFWATRDLEVGDIIFAKQDAPSAEGHYAVASKDLDAASIKTLYESNADTNAYDDAAVSAVAASKTITDFITVTQGVNLDTIETNSNASKVITDFITVTQAVNLDNIESYSNASKVITDWITVTQAVDLDTIETNSNASKVITDWITVTQAVDLDTIESDTATNNAKVTNASHTGDVSGATALTIGANKVTLGMMATMATASILGRNTGGAGNVEVLSAATVKTILSLNNVENTALSTWAGTSSITTLGTISTGTWSATDIAVTAGGTGASDASTARTNLGVAIGSDVQAYDADTSKLDVAETRAASINFADNELIRPMLKDYSEVTSALGDLGGGTDDISIEDGNVVSATVSTSSETFTFSDPIATDDTTSFTLVLTNGGSQTVNWPDSVDWAGGTAPSLTASGVDVLVFITIDGGTIWHGFAASLDSK
jgi:hypothetical protein